MYRQVGSIWVLSLLMSALAAQAWATERDQHGQSHPLDGSSGRYTVVDFAASWCKPCLRSLPELEALAKDFPHHDFVIVDVDDRVEGRDQLVEQLDLTLPVVWDGEYRLAERFEPQAMPATFIVDPQGQVIYSHTGYDAEVWRQLVEQLRSLDPPAP